MFSSLEEGTVSCSSLNVRSQRTKIHIYFIGAFKLALFPGRLREGYVCFTSSSSSLLFEQTQLSHHPIIPLPLFWKRDSWGYHPPCGLGDTRKIWEGRLGEGQAGHPICTYSAISIPLKNTHTTFFLRSKFFSIKIKGKEPEGKRRRRRRGKIYIYRKPFCCDSSTEPRGNAWHP